MQIYGAPRHCYPDVNVRPQTRHTGGDSRSRRNTRALRRIYKRRARTLARREIAIELHTLEIDTWAS